MKTIAALALGLILLNGPAALAETTEADQKWLDSAKTMVAKGKAKIVTESEVRANLLKEWCMQKNYTVLMLKNDQGFTLQVRKS